MENEQKKPELEQEKAPTPPAQGDEQDNSDVPNEGESKQQEQETAPDAAKQDAQSAEVAENPTVDQSEQADAVKGMQAKIAELEAAIVELKQRLAVDDVNETAKPEPAGASVDPYTPQPEPSKKTPRF